MTINALVQARIDDEVKREAAAVLRGMGLTVSDAVRLMLTRVAREKTLPFDVRTPNGATGEAMVELERDGGKRLESVDALMADLRADD